MTIEPLFNISVEHGEGPVWDERNNNLYWVDLLAGTIYQGNIKTGQLSKKNVRQPLGSIALRESGGIVLAAHEGFGFTDMNEDAVIELFNNPQPFFPETRFNDGKVDPLGNFVAGTMTFAGDKPIGSLFLLKPDRSVKCIEKDLLLSNGVDWSPDGTTCYLADTNAHCIYAYHYDIKNGGISNRKKFIEFKDNEWPDGLCVDAGGNLWVAMWAGSSIMKFNVNGQLTDTIKLPVTHPTSCCFGGNDLSILFITTSKLVLSANQKSQQPWAGMILSIKTNSKGMIMRRYKG